MPDYKHLKFHKVIKNPAKYPSGGSVSDAAKEHKLNRNSHALNLKRNLSHLEHYYNAYFANKHDDEMLNNYEIPLILKTDPDSNLLKDLDKYGLNLVCEDYDGFLLVATDKQGLLEFKEKLSGFINEKRGSALVADIHEISNETLPQRRLSDELYDKYPFNNDEIFTVDISIDCKGLPFRVTNQRKKETDLEYEHRATQNRMSILADWEDLIDKREDNFYKFLQHYDSGWEILNERIMDNYDLNHPPEDFEIRMKINGKILNDIVLNYPYVFEINYPDTFVCEDTLQTESTERNLTILPPEPNSCNVSIIDSGIQEGHRYLNKAINQLLSKTYIDSQDRFDNVREGGHGTRVAGRVLYPENIPENGEYKLPCYIVNSKILDSNCKIPEKYIPGILYEKIVLDNFNKVKIYNSSINSSVPMRTRHMSYWGFQIDKLTNEKDILFIQSAGNIAEEYANNFHCLGIKQMLQQESYPEYLFSNLSSRIANPAQSLFALTVGSVAKSDFEDSATHLKSLETKDDISCFSRVGFGLWKSIKPEVVEVGGGLNITEDNNLIKKEETSIQTIRTSPPGPAYACDAIGTSFSTPKVTQLAALLQNSLPGHSALLYKTLIVHSAKWPEKFDYRNTTDEEIVKIVRAIGYGVPNKEYALNNAYNRVTFITEDKVSIKSGDAHIYYIPIPESLRRPDSDTDIKVTVTLCYTSNPRRTRIRKRGYLSTWLDWTTSKPDDTLENFEKNIFKNLGNGIKNQNQKWMLGAKDENDGEIDGVSRNNSATQKDWQIIKSYQLPEKFAIAVRSHKGWDLDPFSMAQYSLAVSIESLDENIPIYSEIQLALENEIEAENEIEITI